MTCNSAIKDNLFGEQTLSDRPDKTSRVFDIMKDNLINEVTKQNIFGKVKAYIYVIKF